jgi:hypothetical protein
MSAPICRREMGARPQRFTPLSVRELRHNNLWSQHTGYTMVVLNYISAEMVVLRIIQRLLFIGAELRIVITRIAVYL